MGSSGGELDNLVLNLKQVQEKFMEWTGDSFKKSLLEDKENHENVLACRGGKMFVCKLMKGAGFTLLNDFSL